MNTLQWLCVIASVLAVSGVCVLLWIASVSAELDARHREHHRD